MSPCIYKGIIGTRFCLDEIFWTLRFQLPLFLSFFLDPINLLHPPGDTTITMEIDYAPSHNPNLFGSLSISPPTSMFEAFSPLYHLNDEFLDALNPNTDDDPTADWLKPLLFDESIEHDLQQNILNLNDFGIKYETRIEEDEDEKKKHFPYSSMINEKNSLISLPSHAQAIQCSNELIEFLHQQSAEQQLPSTTTTTVRLIHQPKLEPAEIPTTLYLNGNEYQFHPIIQTNNSKTIGHTYTSKVFPTSPSVPVVPARVLKGKKFKRGGRVTSRA